MAAHSSTYTCETSCPTNLCQTNLKIHRRKKKTLKKKSHHKTVIFKSKSEIKSHEGEAVEERDREAAFKTVRGEGYLLI